METFHHVSESSVEELESTALEAKAEAGDPRKNEDHKAEAYWAVRGLLEENHLRLLQALEVSLLPKDHGCGSQVCSQRSDASVMRRDLSNASRTSRGSISSSARPWKELTASMMPSAHFAVRQSYFTSQREKKKTAKAVVQKSKTPATVRKSVTEKGKSLLRYVVASSSFEATFCGLIFLNAVLYGAETQYLADSENEAYAMHFSVAGHFFTGAFTLEILLRIGAGGFFCSQQWLWNFLDALVVLLALMEAGSSLVGFAAPTNLTHVRLVRVARTVRVLRVVRLLSVLASLRILIYSVLNTLHSLIWTLVLLAGILYLFGLGITQATMDYIKDAGADEAVSAELDLLYGSLFRSVGTLFLSITNGVSWGQVSSPLSWIHPFWEALFCVFITFTYFAVLNVVTGVFCQSAIESANRDKDTLVQAQISMQKVYTEQLQLLFEQIDEDSNGVITLSMFEESLEDEQVRAYFNGLDLTTEDAWNLFKLLDVNETNFINVDEFVAGCLRLRGRARSIDIHMLLHHSQWTMKRLGDVLERLAGMWVPPPVMRSSTRRSLGSAGSEDGSLPMSALFSPSNNDHKAPKKVFL